MVIRIPSFAYQEGFGGHFHNDNAIAALRDIPGLIIAAPSNGPDAAKILRSCIKLAAIEKRIVIFLEPIALYMKKDLHTQGDNAWLFHYPDPKETIQLGEMGIFGDKTANILIISYANGFYLSRQAEKILNEKYHVAIKLIDLRWLLPLNERALLAEAKRVKHILIVDESRRTGSMSEGLMSLFVENLEPLPKIKRLTGDDCFIPLGNSWRYILPSRDDIIQHVLRLMLP